MTLKKWSFLFYTTLLLGAIGAVISGTIIGQDTLKNGFADFGMGVVGNLLAGLMFSVISQMGFFAYLTIHYLALVIIKRNSLWQGIQVVFILFVFVDFVVLRHDVFAPGTSIINFIWFPLGLIVYAGIVAFFKVRATNKTAWIPTVFFMFVVTILEWMPALRNNNLKSMVLMLIPLLLCNTWQIMQLHRLLKANGQTSIEKNNKAL
ncbi:KinB-signaling pathway activation protein [Aneurinibacillus tyrosinisolvens]|uniref:KinB-signaling pathway activation protein n=1 Tax=Aneurinibacillus tyrosinisolvens TaxID=1443435 RepID=UPI00063F6288|nr:KinB-signaling pathway activation protein [Aneurinibacillus tyrosinisolvens]